VARIVVCVHSPEHGYVARHERGVHVYVDVREVPMVVPHEEVGDEVAEEARHRGADGVEELELLLVGQRLVLVRAGRERDGVRVFLLDDESGGGGRVRGTLAD
jgi:hypothetical protein